MATATEKQLKYESLVILPPETSQDGIDGLMDKVKKTLAKEKGDIRGVQVWGRRRMSFPIKQHKDGLYVYFDFDGSFQSSKAVSQFLRLTDSVIRHIVVKREEPKVIKPKASSASKESSDASAKPAPAAKAETSEKSAPSSK